MNRSIPRNVVFFFKHEWGERPETKAILYGNCNNQNALKLTDLSGLAQYSMAGRCEYVNELSGFINHSMAKIKLNCFQRFSPYRAANTLHVGHNQAGRQCTVRINATLRRVRVTIVAVEKQLILHILSVCVCSLRYAACGAHAPYYTVICGLYDSTIFFQILS